MEDDDGTAKWLLPAQNAVSEGMRPDNHFAPKGLAMHAATGVTRKTSANPDELP